MIEHDPSSAKREMFRDIALLVVLGALVLFPSFPMRDLWTPDEPRYFEVAREMVVLDNYLVPHLNGTEYAEKPPLFFWLTAGFYKLGFGYNSGRLVSALAAIGTVLLTYSLARRFMPGPGPVISGLATLTTVLFLDAKSGYINPLLVFLMTGALFAGHKALQPETARRTLWWIAAYGFCALGVLTKGPASLVPVLILLPYAVLNRHRIRSGIAGHVIGGVLLLAIVLAWLLPALNAGGGLYEHRLLDRGVAGVEGHREPFYYYLVHYAVDFLPWSLVLPLAAAATVRQWRKAREESLLLAVLWIVALFVLFSALPAKRRGYLMPLTPAVGLLIGYYISLLARGEFPWPKWNKVLSYITLAGFALLGAGAPVYLGSLVHTDIEHPGWNDILKSLPSFSTGTLAVGILTGLAIITMSVLGIRAVRNRAHGMAAAMIIAIMLVLSLVNDLLVTPHQNQFTSAKPFCDQAKPYLTAAQKLHLLNDNLGGVYNLYTGILSMPVLTESKEIEKALAADCKVAMIVEQRSRLRLLGEDTRSCPIVLQSRVGSRIIELIINWDPKTGRRIVPPSP